MIGAAVLLLVVLSVLVVTLLTGYGMSSSAAAALQYLFVPCHPIQFAGSLLVYMQCLVSVQTAGAVVLWARKVRQRATRPLPAAAEVSPWRRFSFFRSAWGYVGRTAGILTEDVQQQIMYHGGEMVPSLGSWNKHREDAQETLEERSKAR
eukprot:scaffold32054_cov83-Skeletonema_dohrnii-CCMP3373.AAC.1